MTLMKAAVIPAVHAHWELQDVTKPEPGPHQVLVKVHACGIGYADSLLAEGVLSFRPFPLVTRHEGVGEIVAVGEGVVWRKVGDRVGMPVTQKPCGRCEFCRGNHPYSFVTGNNCVVPILTGVNVDGGQAEYVAVDELGTILPPDGISYENAAPTVCAGLHGLGRTAPRRRAPGRPDRRGRHRRSGALGVQFAKAAGYHVIAVTHSPAKHALARELGADDSVSNGDELKAAGGADALLHTSPPHAPAIDAMKGLRPRGKLILMGISANDEFPLPALAMTDHSYEAAGCRGPHRRRGSTWVARSNWPAPRSRRAYAAMSWSPRSASTIPRPAHLSCATTSR